MHEEHEAQMMIDGVPVTGETYAQMRFAKTNEYAVKMFDILQTICITARNGEMPTDHQLKIAEEILRDIKAERKRHA